MKPGVPSNNSNRGGRADVVSAGLAGISAARVVFDYFSEVVILNHHFHGIAISRLARAYLPACDGYQYWPPHLMQYRFLEIGDGFSKNHQGPRSRVVLLP